jgi:F-type H+-transporting ATPase subunit b
MDQSWGIPGNDELHESTEAHGGTNAPNPLVQLDPGLFIWTILTFLILFFVLAKFAWKPLLLALETRENTIKSSLEDAEKAKTELERLNAETEVIMAKARSEAQTIRVDAKSAAEKIKADVMVQAGEDAKKIREDANKQIQVEKDKAMLEIRKEVVNLTMSIAEKVIRKNLSKDDNQSLIEDSIKHLKGYDA